MTWFLSQAKKWRRRVRPAPRGPSGLLRNAKCTKVLGGCIITYMGDGAVCT